MWSRAQIYDYIRNYRPKLHASVPRIYGHPVCPATLVATESVGVYERGFMCCWAVHIWQPHDDRGVVAVNYPFVDHMPLCFPYLSMTDWAHRLRDRQGFASTSVVVGEKRRNSLMGRAAAEPVLVAADRPTAKQPAVGEVWADLPWAALGNLFQTEVPWWPAEDRPSLDQILSWKPTRLN